MLNSFKTDFSRLLLKAAVYTSPGSEQFLGLMLLRLAHCCHCDTVGYKHLTNLSDKLKTYAAVDSFEVISQLILHCLVELGVRDMTFRRHLESQDNDTKTLVLPFSAALNVKFNK